MKFRECIKRHQANKFFKLIKNNLDKNLNWYYISSNPNITFEIITNNLDLDWDWNGICLNPNITWEIVQAHPNHPWNFGYLSSNLNITIDIINANLDKPWNRYYLSKNPNITWQIVKTNPHIKWDRDGLYRNPNITWDLILHLENPLLCMLELKEPALTLKLSMFWKNPNFIFNRLAKHFSNIENVFPFGYILTYKYIRDHPDKNWDWQIISKLNFTLQNQLTERKYLIKWHAVSIIKRNFIRAFWDPTYLLCQKRLTRSLEKDEYSVW